MGTHFIGHNQVVEMSWQDTPFIKHLIFRVSWHFSIQTHAPLWNYWLPYYYEIFITVIIILNHHHKTIKIPRFSTPDPNKPCQQKACWLWQCFWPLFKHVISQNKELKLWFRILKLKKILWYMRGTKRIIALICDY